MKIDQIDFVAGNDRPKELDQHHTQVDHETISSKVVRVKIKFCPVTIRHQGLQSAHARFFLNKA